MTRQKRGQKTRAHILDAAAECFIQSGYDRTSVSEICSTAGVSKGAFYHHFPSKQALFLALFGQWVDELESAITTIRLSDNAIETRLDALVDVARDVLETTGGRAPMFLEFYHQAARDPAVWQTLIEPYRRFEGALAQMIREDVAKGNLRSVDPDQAAYALVSLGTGMVLQAALDPEHVIDHQAIHLLLYGLAERRPRDTC